MKGLEPSTPCLQSPLGRMTANADGLLWLVRAVSVCLRTTPNDGARAIDARWRVAGPRELTAQF